MASAIFMHKFDKNHTFPKKSFKKAFIFVSFYYIIYTIEYLRTEGYFYETIHPRP